MTSKINHKCWKPKEKAKIPQTEGLFPAPLSVCVLHFCPPPDLNPHPPSRAHALSVSRPFSHRQLRGQLSLLVMARLLKQQERLPLWQEKAQVSVCLSILWGLGDPSQPLLPLFLKVGSLRPGEFKVGLPFLFTSLHLTVTFCTPTLCQPLRIKQ